MKCTNCGGRLGADLNFCPYCGVRVEMDLKQVHFRDLGPNPSLPCPDCQTPLDVIEFEHTPKICLERCSACHGMFFNPGEIEALLESHTNNLILLDNKQLDALASETHWDEEIRYLKCPVCLERMSRINFGRTSGIVLDRCWTHGFWVQNGEYRRLAEWWRAGGKLLYQEYQQERARQITTTRSEAKPDSHSEQTVLPEISIGWEISNLLIALFEAL